MMWLSRMLLGAPLAAERIVPAIDIVRLTICGLGSTATRTDIENRLGPAADYFMRRKGQLAYPQLGLELSVDDHQMLVGFSVVTEPAVLAQYAWGPGRVRGLPDEAWFVARLGPPTARNNDHQEVVLEWTRGTLFIGIELGRSGQLTDLFVDYR